jgi:hypothetical protein
MEMKDGRGRTRAWWQWVGAMAVLAVVFPATAGATDYCVNTSCGGQDAGSLQQALGFADDASNADRIFLGPGNYPAPSASGYSYVRPDGPVEIIGAGQNATAVTSPSATTDEVLQVYGGAGTSIHDLTVSIPANVAPGVAGLQTNGTASRVTVSENWLQSNSRYGVLLNGGVLEDSMISLGPQATGVSFQDGGTPTVRRSSIHADTGIASAYGGVVERTGMKTTTRGVSAWRNTTTIRSSIIRVDNPAATAIRADVAPGADTTVVADGVNIVGPGGPSAVGLRADTAFAPTQSAEIILRNSLLRGFATALWAEAGGGPGTARIVATYSDYDGGGNQAGDQNEILSESSVTNVGDVGFEDPSDGNYALLAGSLLIDAGAPSTDQGLDYIGNPLVADGDGDGVARRDIGAYERDGVPFTGPTPTGGEPAGAGSGMGGPPPDSQAPVVSGFRITRSPFALGRTATAVAARAPRGTSFRYSLSEPARVSLTIQRRVAGGRRRTVGTLRRSGAAGPNRLRFSGRIGRRALRPGHYQALIRATDAAGNRSARGSVRFRLVRG